jgi:hypothetical protein
MPTPLMQREFAHSTENAPRTKVVKTTGLESD